MDSAAKGIHTVPLVHKASIDTNSFAAAAAVVVAAAAVPGLVAPFHN
jgi:hypothetical protein